MPPKSRRAYWDANVFLALFDKGDTSEKAEQRRHSILWLEQARNGRIVIVTSTVTLTEARRGEGEPPLPGEEHATIRAFMRHRYIEVVPLDRGTAELAADYAEQFRLKNRDAIHLATAVRSKATVLLAWNGHFHRTNAMSGAPIPIALPEWTQAVQLELDAAGVFSDGQQEEDESEF
jgi:predicted nucleic acid-binding protein